MRRGFSNLERALSDAEGAAIGCSVPGVEIARRLSGTMDAFSPRRRAGGCADPRRPVIVVPRRAVAAVGSVFASAA